MEVKRKETNYKSKTRIKQRSIIVEKETNVQEKLQWSCQRLGYSEIKESSQTSKLSDQRKCCSNKREQRRSIIRIGSSWLNSEIY